MSEHDAAADEHEVEIYVAGDAAALLRWLPALCVSAPQLAVRRRGGFTTHAGAVELRSANGATCVAQALVVESAAGAFHSLSLTGPVLPFADDVELARVAAPALGVEVRCNARGWQPGDDEDDGWLAVTPAGERPIRWRTD